MAVPSPAGYPAYSDAGGFIPDEEPEQSSTNLPLSDYAASVQLPEQRHKPLRAGTNKEWDTNRWIESKMTSLNRKHAKRFEPGKAFGIPSQGAQDTSKETAQQVDDEPGYSNLRELAADVEQIMNVLWVCGTPSIQIPQMISLASFFEAALPAYPFEPRPAFALLAKFDVIFASLLTGRNILTNAPLPGCIVEADKDGELDPLDEELMLSYSKKPEAKSKVSTTEKVRIKSIAEQTRLIVLDVQAGRRREGLRGNIAPNGMPSITESEATSDTDPDAIGFGDTQNDDEDEMDLGDTSEPSGVGKYQMDAARVYEMTIHLLGDDLGSEAIVID